MCASAKCADLQRAYAVIVLMMVLLALPAAVAAQTDVIRGRVTGVDGEALWMCG